MFTGLIEHLGEVEGASPTPAGVRLRLRAPSLVREGQGPSNAESKGPGVGESISVDGVCLTVATPPRDAGAGLLHFDVIPETLSRTTLGTLAPGQRVHLEPAATLATLLGGHMVQGHVDGVGVVREVRTQGEWRATIALPEDLMVYLAPKGSICVQGVSLTVASIDVPGNAFDIALIPTTLEKTTLGNLKQGSRVNIECDAIGKQVVHALTHYASRLPNRR